MYRKEEEDQRISRIAQSTAGMGFWFLDAWAEVDGQRVDAVFPGKQFRIKVKYSAYWPDKPFWSWVVGVQTEIPFDYPDNVMVYDNTSILGQESNGIMTLDNPQPLVMPNASVLFKIKAYGSEHAGDYWSAPPFGIELASHSLYVAQATLPDLPDGGDGGDNGGGGDTNPPGISKINWTPIALGAGALVLGIALFKRGT